MVVEQTEFGLWEILEGVMKLMALKAHEKALELTCQVAPDVPDRLVGDPVRLRQIAINLVGNAVKFTAAGEVGVRVNTVERDTEEVELHVAISDTGIGIPADMEEAIFEAFSQADSSTTRRFGGTGLGLTISSQLVRMMGGRIWVESAEGEGSVFHFTARFGLADETAATPAVPALERLRDLRVIGIDDSATNRTIIEEMLQSWDMDPTVVDSGAAALATIKRAVDQNQAHDLVLLDAAMPGMDSPEVIRQIRALQEFDGQIVLMVSSLDDQEYFARMQALGIGTYLRKPITRSGLLDAIADAMSISAPKIDALEEGQVAAAEQLITSSPLSILLAEDNAVNQKVAMAMLAKAGDKVEVAENGQQVLDALARQSFDLVLMDIEMPEMDGLEATRQIRLGEVGTVRHLPIVAMTAHSMEGDRERFLEAGMDDYVTKPIHQQTFFQIIDRFRKTPPESSGDPVADPRRDGESLL